MKKKYYLTMLALSIALTLTGCKSTSEKQLEFVEETIDRMDYDLLTVFQRIILSDSLNKLKLNKYNYDELINNYTFENNSIMNYESLMEEIDNFKEMKNDLTDGEYIEKIILLKNQEDKINEYIHTTGAKIIIEKWNDVLIDYAREYYSLEKDEKIELDLDFDNKSGEFELKVIKVDESHKNIYGNYEPHYAGVINTVKPFASDTLDSYYELMNYNCNCEDSTEHDKVLNNLLRKTCVSSLETEDYNDTHDVTKNKYIFF